MLLLSCPLEDRFVSVVVLLVTSVRDVRKEVTFVVAADSLVGNVVTMTSSDVVTVEKVVI